jgi:hypothetical protein
MGSQKGGRYSQVVVNSGLTVFVKNSKSCGLAGSRGYGYRFVQINIPIMVLPRQFKNNLVVFLSTKS